jgi:pilus assembly protein CpaB
LVVLLALVFGGSAAVGINNLRNTGSAADSGEKVTVLVATTEVPRGKTVTADMFRTRDYPKDLAPAGALSGVEDAVERTALVSLAKDEVVLDTKLAPRNAGRGLAPFVPEGKRACTITTNIASSVAGFILPGNHVDVLLTVAGDDASGGGSTTTLLEDLEILAVDQKVDAPSDNRSDPNLRSVTLLVDQTQAAKLALGQNRGSLQLTLRNPNDRTASDARPATLNDIKYRPQKPLATTLKDMMDATSKVFAVKWPSEPLKAPLVEASALPAEIRTIRGTAEGIVYIKPTQPAAKGQ